MVSDNSEFTARYLSDLSDEEWGILKPIIEELDPYPLGRPQKSDRREILNSRQSLMIIGWLSRISIAVA